MNMQTRNATGSKTGFALLTVACLLQQSASGQATQLPLTDLSFFQPASKTWRIAGDVQADLATPNVLKTGSGTGVLVNLPTDSEHGADLYTAMEHGDADIELEYMMAKGSNSGIYLQGRYEMQLMDSWGTMNPKAGDNGGMYQRWDDTKPEGQKGFEGNAPRINASKAPGLWQTLKISFQAPRFDASGNKIENARILSATLNGVLIHENVVLTGPTRGAMKNNEVTRGPLRIQGDHGAVAFRNVKITAYDKPRPELTNLEYAVYKGRFEAEPASYTAAPEAKGPSMALSSTVSNLDNEFLIRYTGTLKVAEPGTYNFTLGAPGGSGALRINNEKVINLGGRGGRGNATLPAGDLPFELLYSKWVDWARPALGLSISGPGIREFIASDAPVSGSDAPDPILVQASNNTILRSFMDLPGRYRVVHAVSVGSDKALHYTYDMDKGTIVQVWRGDFLDATPMWNDRGDGSSRPRGAVQYFGSGAPKFTLAKLDGTTTAWPADTAGTGFRPRGYMLDERDRPSFRYEMYGAKVTDASKVGDDGQSIQRTIKVEGAPSNLYARVASGKKIESVGNGLYLIDDKAYYVRIDDAAGATPAVRNNTEGGEELLVPVKASLTYSLIY